MHRNRYKIHCLKKEFASPSAPSPLVGEGRGEGDVHEH